METADYRTALIEFIGKQAQPPDKFEHQPRLFALAQSLGTAGAYDEDVLFAAAWLHDLGVFVGHRPEDPAALARWDHIAYATAKAPDVLRSMGFPTAKIPAVLECIRTHLPSTKPTTVEGRMLRDADILEQLGAVGMTRMISKVGRDTRYRAHRDAIHALQKAARDLPAQLELPQARAAAAPRVAMMEAFFRSCQAEGI